MTGESSGRPGSSKEWRGTGIRAAPRTRALFNTIITNVPGPQVPRYLLGARLLEVYPQVPLVDRVDLGIALVSYAGHLHWGLNADYDAVPDLSAFRRALDDAFEELCRAPRPGAVAVEPMRRVSEAATSPANGEGDHAVEAHHQALTSAARERHDALSAAIDRLERALAAPASQRAKPWSERVLRDLSRVEEAIRIHVEGVEEPRGLFDEIQDHAPRLSSRVGALKEDHKKLSAQATHLATQLPAEPTVDFGALRQEAAELLAELRAHRAHEADLIYEAFWTDLGVGD